MTDTTQSQVESDEQYSDDYTIQGTTQARIGVGETELPAWLREQITTQGDSNIRGRLVVESIGGIESDTLDFEDGVTGLYGANATNRTSLMQALSVVLGGEQHANVHRDEESGSVSLTLSDAESDESVTVTREVKRSGDQSESAIPTDDGLFSDATIVDSFVSLLRTSPTRSAIRQHDAGQLRDLLFGPVDADEVEEEKERLLANKREIEAEIERVEAEIEQALDGRSVEAIEADIDQQQETIEDLDEEIEAVEQRLTEIRDAEQRTQPDDELVEQLDELQEKRRELKNEKERAQIELNAAIDSLEDIDDDEIDRRAQLKNAYENTVTTALDLSDTNWIDVGEYRQLAELKEHVTDSTGSVDERAVAGRVSQFAAAVFAAGRSVITTETDGQETTESGGLSAAPAYADQLAADSGLGDIPATVTQQAAVSEGDMYLLFPQADDAIAEQLDSEATAFAATVREAVTAIARADERISTELKDKRQQAEQADAAAGQLNELRRFNRQQIEQGALDDIERVLDVGEGQDNDKINCWTCGSAVTPDDIKQTLSVLDEQIEQVQSRRNSTQSAIRELSEMVSNLEMAIGDLVDAHDEAFSLFAEKNELQQRVASTEENVEQLDAQIDELDTEIADVEETIEQARTETKGELIETQQELDGLKTDRTRAVQEREALENTLEEIATARDDLDELTDRVSTVESELDEVRTRIDELEQDAIETFNDSIEKLRSAMGYENISRIWIEQVVSENERAFELHVIREGGSGAYEDSLETLSESETEVIGIMVGVTGYLIHDIGDKVPFLLLDAVDMFDADRLATLIEYVQSETTFTFVTVLPDAVPELESATQTPVMLIEQS